MARIRTIKPEFFTSITIADLDPLQRLTFIGLWTHVDDEGRCVDDSRLIKAAIWPLDDRSAADVENDLRALTEASLITRYMLNGKRYLAVTNWSEHQKINRATDSRFPAPEDGEILPPEPPTSPNGDSLRTHAQLTESSLPERKGTGNREQGREQGTNTPPPPAAPASGGRVHSPPRDRFDEFWSAYPRKVGKGGARKAWLRALKKGTDPDAIIWGARAYATNPRRSAADIQYTAHPATWLNAERWDDAAEAPPQSPAARPSARDQAFLQSQALREELFGTDSRPSLNIVRGELA